MEIVADVIPLVIYVARQGRRAAAERDVPPADYDALLDPPPEYDTLRTEVMQMQTAVAMLTAIMANLSGLIR